MSKRWYKKHVQDHFVKKANRDGVRSRAAYKLLEIQEKRRIIQSGDTVIDLGSAPGAWSEALVKVVGSGQVIACDLLDMKPIKGVSFVQGDFLSLETQNKLTDLSNVYDVIVSDMAPNLSGNATLDQAEMLKLLEMVMQFASLHLKQGGNVLCKGFHGEMFELMVALFKENFKQTKIIKPEASRSGSKEIYFLGEKFGV